MIVVLYGSSRWSPMSFTISTSYAYENLVRHRLNSSVNTLDLDLGIALFS